MIFHVRLHPEEDGWIVVECPALPGCISQGRDEKEALTNIKEAITGWLWAEDQKALDAMPKDASRYWLRCSGNARKHLWERGSEGFCARWLGSTRSDRQPYPDDQTRRTGESFGSPA